MGEHVARDRRIKLSLSTTALILKILVRFYVYFVNLFKQIFTESGGLECVDPETEQTHPPDVQVTREGKCEGLRCNINSNGDATMTLTT